MTTEESPEPEPQIEPIEPEEESTDSKPEAQLQAIVEEAKASRLAPADEEQAVQLLKQTVAGGPKALPATLEALVSLPWNASVKAVTEAWPETKPAGRTRLITGLAKMDSDASRRIRLSLARGLHAQDDASAVKLLTSVCDAMGGAKGGSTTKDRQIFANVMLGKAKPWLMNVSMAGMETAEVLALITPVLESCDQAPVFTQIWVLRWIIDAEKFDALPPEHIEAIGKSINRWQARWRKEFRKIIPKLPDSLEAALGPHAPAAAPAEPAEAEAEPEEAEEEPSEPEAEAPEPERPQRQRPVRERRGASGAFDLGRSLREIEAYVARLRSELQQVQTAARRREPGERRRGGDQQAAASGDVEELRRHIEQLEQQNEELRQRFEELASDHEDRAATIEIGDAVEQFKTLVALKLKQEYADYAAISRESPSEVVRRHAQEILGRVFSVLEAEGVKFPKEE